MAFPAVYFGSLLAVAAAFGPAWLATLPSAQAHRASTLPLQSLLPVVSVLFALAALLPVLAAWRRFLKQNVFSEMASQWAGLHPGSVKHDKFVEQAWLAFHYSLITVMEIKVLWDKPWFPPVLWLAQRRAISAPQAEREADQADWGLRIVYMVQLAFYALELVTLLRSKVRRSDFFVYLFHHVYTVLLLAGSWLSFHHRIGSLVLFLHDVGDIFLPIGKCYSCVLPGMRHTNNTCFLPCRYAEDHIRATKSRTAFEFHKNIGTFFFVLFIIFFAIPRLFFFGGLIFQGPSEFKWYSCCGLGANGDECGPCVAGPAWSTGLLTLLGLLYPMHVFWMILILKMAIRVLTGQYDDVRSEGEEEEEGQNGQEKNGKSSVSGAYQKKQT